MKLALIGILLLAVFLAWRPPSTPPQPVELTFVRYEYDAVVLNLANRTWSRLILIPQNVSFDRDPHIADARSELHLHTARMKVSTSWPPRTIAIFCVPRPSQFRLRANRLLKKIGINIASTNFVVSVELPPFDPIPMRSPE